jgi:hypothetical protein
VARELAGLEHLAHDVTVVVRVPARADGWKLPGGMSVHVWRPRRQRPGAALVELREAVRRLPAPGGCSQPAHGAAAAALGSATAPCRAMFAGAE